jgi:hypothetical protein
MITVTAEGNIVLDSCDGDGKVLETACLNPDDYVCDGEADSDTEDLEDKLKELDKIEDTLNEAGIGPSQNPLHNEQSEAREKEEGKDEEGRGS